MAATEDSYQELSEKLPTTDTAASAKAAASDTHPAEPPREAPDVIASYSSVVRPKLVLPSPTVKRM